MAGCDVVYVPVFVSNVRPTRVNAAIFIFLCRVCNADVRGIVFSKETAIKVRRACGTSAERVVSIRVETCVMHMCGKQFQTSVTRLRRAGRGANDRNVVFVSHRDLFARMPSFFGRRLPPPPVTGLRLCFVRCGSARLLRESIAARQHRAVGSANR